MPHKDLNARAKSQDFAVRYPAHILVVEDQPLNQKVMFMLLQRLGYTHIDVASDGQEAVEMVSVGAYELVFMDLLMPVMGGVEAAHAIRRSGAVPRQPAIIATTGHALAAVREECREAGMNAFLAKPVSLDDFRRAIPPCLEENAALRPMDVQAES